MDFITNTHGNTVPHDGGQGFCGAQVKYRSFLERRSLSAATINLHLSAIRRLADESAESGWLSYRPRLNRVLETEEERLGSEADDSAFHANLLQLLRDHNKEMAVPVSRVTERVFMAIFRAVVDLGLASGASPRSTEQRAMRAICGYLLYSAKRISCTRSTQEDSWRTHRH